MGQQVKALAINPHWPTSDPQNLHGVRRKLTLAHVYTYKHTKEKISA